MANLTKLDIFSIIVAAIVFLDVLVNSCNGLWMWVHVWFNAEPRQRESLRVRDFLQFLALHFGLVIAVACLAIADRMHRPRRSLPFLSGTLAALAYLVPQWVDGRQRGMKFKAVPFFLVGFAIEFSFGGWYWRANRLAGYFASLREKREFRGRGNDEVENGRARKRH
ncbi:hypothetical protein MGN70_011091 [Eutypa lata]|uniref:Uncharacterized protein n=1 Tax=Eutypa lata (strain UCR-EL1) TaxID=1287681 RepID=M7SYU6_EUTLA|nr:hypothetical protein UCREL1_10304 [Eutypa lata UCREL1]KAI1247204.1 hypothetical protein MGN70_011091 [Eutypa lata]